MQQHADIIVALISRGRSSPTEQRAQHLDLDCRYLCISDKLRRFQSRTKYLDVMHEEMGFLGDDLNHLASRPGARLLVAISDAVMALCGLVDRRLSPPGGHIAVRECADTLIGSEHKLNHLAHNVFLDYND
jgi:3-deoxy-D-manno-octulosonate 8-phosphate phosphatase KdsC-like HAD superfamily phosphatase